MGNCLIKRGGANKLLGIDVSKPKLFSYTSTTAGSDINAGIDRTYTAPKDCMVCVAWHARNSGNTVNISIDDIDIAIPIYSGNTYTGSSMILPLLKGQTLKMKSSQIYASIWSMFVFEVLK